MFVLAAICYTFCSISSIKNQLPLVACYITKKMNLLFLYFPF